MMTKNKRFLHQYNMHLDWPLLLGILVLSVLGLLILYSANQDIALVQRQCYRLGIGLLLMIGLAQIPPRVFYMIAPWLYMVGFSLLVFVLLIGQISKGGQRWLDLWVVRFQPSDIMKIAVPLMVARMLDREVLPPKLQSLFLPMLLILLPAILIAKQPDLDTALLILSSGLLVIFFAGISWKLIFSLIATALAACPLLWMFMRDYQKQRVLTLINPEFDPLGSGYHIMQAKIAIGSGGLHGKGWLNGTQSALEFLPERATDSIFAVFSEEFGLVGCLILLILYLCIIIRGLYIGVQAQNTFTRLLSGSLIMTLFVYVFVNIGMITGILPVVGIPLPFISYGGTSLVTLMASFGVLMSIRTHRMLLAK